MSSQSWLLYACSAMFVGALLAAIAPLLLPRFAHIKHTINLFSAGLLIGTSTAVLIPEAVGLWFMSACSKLRVGTKISENHDDIHDLPTWQIGVVLLGGFVLMMIVQILSPAHSHDPGHNQIATEGTAGAPKDRAVTTNSSKAIAAWGLLIHSAMDGVSLGIATAGAAMTDVDTSGEFSSSQEIGHDHTSGISQVILIAIMLHKAPAAFGLSSILFPLERGEQPSGIVAVCRSAWSRLTSHKDMFRLVLLFAASAPVAALVSFGAARLFFSGSAAPEASSWLASLFLFAAGTFLHVAVVHALPEALESLNTICYVHEASVNNQYSHYRGTSTLAESRLEQNEILHRARRTMPPSQKQDSNSTGRHLDGETAYGAEPHRSSSSTIIHLFKGRWGRSIAIGILVAGMLTPIVISSVVGHGHS